MGWAIAILQPLPAFRSWRDVVDAWRRYAAIGAEAERLHSGGCRRMLLAPSCVGFQKKTLPKGRGMARPVP